MPGGKVGTALGDGGLVVAGPGLVVLRCVREGLKHWIVALRLNEAKRGGELGLRQFVHQAVQLLPVRDASMVPRERPEPPLQNDVPNRVPK